MCTCLIESYVNCSVVMPTLGWVIDNSSKDIDSAEARLTLGQRGYRQRCLILSVVNVLKFNESRPSHL